MPMSASVDIEPDVPDRITVDCSFHVKDVVKRVPGARWSSKNRTWTVPLTWNSCLALRSEFGDQLLIGSKLRLWATAARERQNELVSQRVSLEPTARFFEGSEPGWEDLFSYQMAGAELVSLADGKYLIFDETGCGKSRTSLAGIAKLEDPFPLLIVAPKSMLLTWEKEISNFFGKDVLDVRVVAGTPAVRRRLLEPGGDVYIVSYGSLKTHSRVLGFGKAKLTDAQKESKELQDIKFNTVLADEAHRAKTPSAIQTRALWGAAGDAKNRIAMTGTPIQENAEDLWALLHFVDPAVFTSKSAYVERYLQVDWNRWGGREITGIRPETRDEFFALVDSMSRRVTKEAALPFLPPKIYDIRWVELPAPMRRNYNTMLRDLVAELESSTLVADSVLERANRLIQLANSSGEVNDDGVYKMALPSPKIEAFLDDFKAGDFNDEAMVVFSDSRQLIDLLAEELRKLEIEFSMITGDVTGVDRQQAMDDFQAGKVKMILLTRAGGEGITLTAGSRMVRLVRSWSHTVHRQSEDRVHRIGSEMHETITYTDYIVQDTVEEAQFIRLNSKEAAAQEVLRDADLLDILKGAV